MAPPDSIVTHIVPALTVVAVSATAAWGCGSPTPRRRAMSQRPRRHRRRCSSTPALAMTMAIVTRGRTLVSAVTRAASPFAAPTRTRSGKSWRWLKRRARTTAAGEVIVRDSKPQIEAVPNLAGDWSRFVTEEGVQLQTVGHHFNLSRPLSNAERARMDRNGICLSCHFEIPDQSLSASVLHRIAEVGGALPKTNAVHAGLVRKTLLLAGWGQLTGALGATIGAGALGFWWLRRRRRSRARSDSTEPASSSSRDEPQG